MPDKSETTEKLAEQFAREIETKIQADILATEKRHDYSVIAKHYFNIAVNQEWDGTERRKNHVAEY